MAQCPSCNNTVSGRTVKTIMSVFNEVTQDHSNSTDRFAGSVGSSYLYTCDSFGKLHCAPCNLTLKLIFGFTSHICYHDRS